MKSFILFLSYFLSTNAIYAQQSRAFGSELTVGTTFSYIWNKEDNIPLFTEITGRYFVTTKISKRLDAGIEGMTIFTKNAYYPNQKQRYQLAGVLAKYQLVTGVNYNLYANSNLAFGDYCTCGNKDPYPYPRLVYLGIGGGFEYRIWNNLYIDLGFSSYNILQKIENKYGYNLYLVGLNYKFRK